MDGSDGSPPQSICFIRAAESYPKPTMEKEDAQLSVPFLELAGEAVRYLGRTDDGVLAMSNYRIFLHKSSTASETSVPLGLIEAVQVRDLFHLVVNCKDASTVKCSFETAEQCSEWQRRIQLSVGVPETIEALFAFPFYSWTCDTNTSNGGNGVNGSSSSINSCVNVPSNHDAPTSCHEQQQQQQAAAHCAQAATNNDFAERLQRATRQDDDFKNEVERLGFDLNGSWRISYANADFKLCPSYPPMILVPCCITDEMLHNIANFRGSRRLPTVVWRHQKTGAVIARCSQPEVGWLGWRNYKDEQLLKALADACAFDRGEQSRRCQQLNAENACAQTTASTTATLATATSAASSTLTTSSSGQNSPTNADSSHEEVALDEVRKILIVDARSYTSAVTNRARGGGCECIEYYPCAEIEFMNLGNIHVIRKSFQALRQLCASSPEDPNWLGQLEKTMWLQHLSGLLSAAMTVCHAIDKKGRPVLVHCSDGWDRTPQIVATAQLCLDPHYRTVEGFRVLVEREWLSFGHKFSDRCGNGPNADELNERCPVFLQWLDLVHQIHKQFPCSFEFSLGYLIKLAQHSLSCLFGTFLFNSLKDRIDNSVFDRTFSVWPFLSGPLYRNPLYIPNKEKVLWPAHNVRFLYFWSEVYLGSLGNKNCMDFPTCNAEHQMDSISTMVKTRSYGDLMTVGFTQNDISRRSSDPNMAVDPKLTICSYSECNSIGDIQSECDDAPDFMANIIHDTTKKLEHLTTELINNQDNLNLDLTNAKTTTKSDPEPDINVAKNDSECNEHQIKQQQQEHSQSSIAVAESTSLSSSSATTKTATDDLIMLLVNKQDLEDTKHKTTTTQTGCEERSSANLSSDLTRSFNASTLVQDSQPQQNLSQTTRDLLSTDDLDSCSHRSSNNVATLTNQSTWANANLQSKHLTLSDATGFNTASYAPNDLTDGFEKSQPYNTNDKEETLWHGSVNTSTDTLVPIESIQQPELILIAGQHATTHDEQTTTDSVADGSTKNKLTERIVNNCSSNNCDRTDAIYSILPKVHTSSSRAIILNSSASTPATSTAAAATVLPDFQAVAPMNSSIKHDIDVNNTNSNLKQNDNNKVIVQHTQASAELQQAVNEVLLMNSSQSESMDESILILPEHRKLEISVNGKCETIPSASTANMPPIEASATADATTITMTNNGTIAGAGITTSATGYLPSANTVNASTVITAQRRQRTLSSNSRRDAVMPMKNGSTMSRFSLSGVRSLPMTPPSVLERAQITLSCPDGLAHALSEQNIRLHQIVQEHKLREDVLLREIHDMRIALLRKMCPNCNSAPTTTNDEQCSGVDTVENGSICSWEAVEDRSGPSSSTSSSIQQNATSVLWVPDHAVSRCTSCQIEFWLGRRKHHCRSCGQIFCADCSEFWAPLPDEKLFLPVRLCGPCYHAVTTRVHYPSTNSTALLNQLQQDGGTQATSANANMVASPVPAATSKA